MKLSLFLLVGLCFYNSIGQNSSSGSISEAEAKAARAHFSAQRNMNTNNYDLKYHRLEFNVDPSEAFISGKVTSFFEAKENINSIVFELVNNMVVSEVKQRGASLPFVQNSDDEVVITLPQTQAVGVLDSLSISYSGNPVSSGFGSFEVDLHAGEPVMWTLSEPFGAKAWWPCKQDLIDKVDSVDIYITTPKRTPSNKEYIAVANGKKISQSFNGNFQTTHYHHGYPIPAYLVAIAVTNYSVYSHSVANNGDPFSITNYVYPEYLDLTQQMTPVTVDIMNLFSEKFEPYPYADEGYGHAQMNWGGGMEHTTISFMGGFSRGLIAHELGHQWFGDKVTCGSWQDIWLNEGFATYMEGMVIESMDGPSAFKTWKQDQNSYITFYPGGSVYVPAQDTISENRIFDSRLSYDKASMVVHMLRKKLGDSIFFEGCRSYLNDPEITFGYAKTPDLKRNMEAVSGQDLTEFFEDWIFGQGYPSYVLKWNQQNGDFNVKLTQTQSHPSVSFFEAPVPVRLMGTSGETRDIVLDNTYNEQYFNIPVDFTIQNVIFNPEEDLITKFNNVMLSTDVFEYASDISVFPNPTSGIVQIIKPSEVQMDTIALYDFLGRKLFEHIFSNELNLSSYPAGLYFLQLHSAEKVVTKKIVVQ